MEYRVRIDSRRKYLFAIKDRVTHAMIARGGGSMRDGEPSVTARIIDRLAKEIAEIRVEALETGLDHTTLPKFKVSWDLMKLERLCEDVEEMIQRTPEEFEVHERQRRRTEKSAIMHLNEMYTTLDYFTSATRIDMGCNVKAPAKGKED